VPRRQAGRRPEVLGLSSTVLAQGAQQGLTRRGVISGAALLGAGAGLGSLLGGSAAIADRARDADAVAGRDEAVPFYGPHQAGVATAAQECLQFAAFDLQQDNRAMLRELLQRWTAVAARLTSGEPYEPSTQAPGEPPQDTGEAIGLGPARLTLTVGLGPSLFAGARGRSLGLAGVRPAELRVLPSVDGERLDPGHSGGDLCVQACSEDPQVAFHAIHELARTAAGIARLRYSQQGFGRTSSTSVTQATPRNLLGFKDGTLNLRGEATADMEEFVWVKPGEAPRWMAGGTYLIARRIRMLFDRWDASTLEEQQRAIGREKSSGAPLGEQKEYDPLDLGARGADGEPVIPAHAHVRLASPQVNHGQAILRRGYSYAEGIDPHSGEIDAGLFFICFQRSPSRQFIPLLRRLAAHDSLGRFTVHTSSAIFACPPGTLSGGFVGELLFE
jgi:deferrochelatase/peroxidase EfeB